VVKVFKAFLKVFSDSGLIVVLATSNVIPSNTIGTPILTTSSSAFNGSVPRVT